MSVKKKRQYELSKLISSNLISSQQDLVNQLIANGIKATQATVSRDLEDLGAIKIRVPGNNDSVYAIPELPTEQIAPSDHLARVLSEWVVELNRSGDMTILRTPPGCAHVVASAIDRSGIALIIGTIAGDDTVLVISSEGKGLKTEKQIAKLANIESRTSKRKI